MCSFTDYRLLRACDAPEIVPIIVESNEPTGTFGAKGIGEGCMPEIIAAMPRLFRMAQYAQRSSNRYLLARVSTQMLPDGLDSESRRENQIGSGYLSHYPNPANRHNRSVLHLADIRFYCHASCGLLSVNI